MERIDKYRDLDALIAKEILGWKYINVGADYNGENRCQILFYPDKEATQEYYNMLPYEGAPHEAFFVPPYSRELRFALNLAKLTGFNKTIELSELPLDTYELAKEIYDNWKQQDIK